MSLKSLFQRVEHFILRDLWAREPSKGWRRSAWYSLRTGVLVVENTINRELFVRAAALTYQVVFSIIPLFAVMLALLKSFGGLEKMAGQVSDFLLKNLAPSVSEKVVQSMHDAIARLDAKTVSIVGFLVLLYTSVSLLSTIEHAFNQMWGVPRPRSLLRRITIYWTLLTVGPILLAISLATSSFVRNRAAYQWVIDHIPFVGAALLFIVPFLLTWIVFTMLYKIIPNTRVYWRAAIIGSLVAGTAWELGKRLYILFNAKVMATYEIYGSLAAIPVFLLWIYASWAIVLLGAEVAFAAQHVKSYRREVEAPKLSHAFKERLAIHLMVEIARDFLSGKPPGTAEALSERLKVPVRAGSEVLVHLTDAKLLHEMDGKGVASYLPSEDLGRITVRRVIDAMRRTGDDPVIDPSGRDQIEKLVGEADHATYEQLDKFTVKDLAEGKK
jgi:membrane protein